MDYPIWYLNVVPAVEVEWRQKPPDYKYLLAEMCWLAPRFAEWIDGHLVNDPNPEVAAENRAFVRKFYDLFAPIAEFDHLVVEDVKNPEFQVAIQTYSRIRKLLGIPVRKKDAGVAQR